MVGYVLDSGSQEGLQEEQMLHHDFHVLDVLETYENLVLKVCWYD